MYVPILRESHTYGGIKKVALLMWQGLIRYYRPELEQRMKEYHDKKSAAKQIAAGGSGCSKSVAAGQGWLNEPLSLCVCSWLL